jgi:hypothetical protein
MKRGTITVFALLVSSVCFGQTPGTADPQSAHQVMTRAAGMALNDGALPPGMLTVRIVRGAFAGNLVDQAVQVEVKDGSPVTERTGPDGRAQFAHLPVGATVRASATVDGELLTSDAFPMPAESGVRVLLVVEGQAADGPSREPSAAIAPRLPEFPAALTTIDRAVAVRSSAEGSSKGVVAIQAVLSVATLIGFALVLFRNGKGGRHRPVTPDEAANPTE